MGSLVGWLFTLIHVFGGVLSLHTLKLMWEFRVLLRLLLDRNGVVQATIGAAPAFWILMACVTGIALVAIANVMQQLRSWQQGVPFEDAAVRLRMLLYVAMGCLLVDVLWLSTPETFSGPFRLRFSVNAWISATLAYGLWCSLPRLARRFSNRKRRIADLVCMNVVLALLLAEGCLRIAANFWATPLLVTDSTPSQIRRDSERVAPGELRFGFPVNSGGHYDSEFVPRAQRTRPLVVSIGDSFSYGTVPLPYHFTSVAEREYPDAEIYNMGLPGTGPSDYQYLLESEALALEPDLIVIQLFVGNDVASERMLQAPRWYDADSYLLAVVVHRLRILSRVAAEMSERAVERAAGTREQLEVLYPWLEDPRLEAQSMGEEIYLELESRYAWASASVIPGVYERFFAQLKELERAAGDVPLAFVLIPDEFQIEDELWAEVVRRNDSPLDRDRPQRLILEWLRKRGRPVLDLLPLLRAVEPLSDGHPHLYHLRDTHFNARGNEFAGRALAGFIRPLLAGPEPVSLPYQIRFGQVEGRRWLGDGWHDDEGSHVWSAGLVSTLEIPLPSRSDIRMSLSCLPFEFDGRPEQRVSISLNGTAIDEFTLRPGRNEYAVLLPRSALRRAANRIEFRYAYTRTPREGSPDSADDRELAVAWYSIELTAVGSDPANRTVAPAQ